VSDEVDFACLLEAGVVPAPETVDAIGFFDDRLDHLWLVVREIVRDVEHDVADQVPYCRYGFGSDVLQSILGAT